MEKVGNSLALLLVFLMGCASRTPIVKDEVRQQIEIESPWEFSTTKDSSMSNPPNLTKPLSPPLQAWGKEGSKAKKKMRPQGESNSLPPIHSTPKELDRPEPQKKKRFHPITPLGPGIKEGKKDSRSRDDAEVGFEDRFPVGEVLLFEVRFMGVLAGYLQLGIQERKIIEGLPHHSFWGKVWSAPFFSKVYFVEDSFESWVSVSGFRPFGYKIKVNETHQVKQAALRIQGNKAFFVEKKIKGDGVEETNLEWEVAQGALDVFSTLFYIRMLKWDLGARYQVIVTDREKNLVYSASAIRQDEFSLENKTIPTLVLKPEAQLQGNLKSTSEFLIWIEQQPPHRILKIQAKLAFGSLRADAVEIKTGDNVANRF